MKVREKTMQLSLITFGLLLIILTYFIYPKINKKQFEAEKVVEIEQEENKEDSSVQTSFEGIKYKGESSTNSFTIQSEKKIIHNFANFLHYLSNKNNTIASNSTIAEQNNNANEIINIYHWGQAELNYFKYINENYPLISFHKFNLINVLDYFRTEPIIIQGIFNFGLKSIGSALYKHKFIKTTWNKNDNGLETMIRFKEICIHHNRLIPLKRYVEVKEIIEYNRIDCQVLYEIVDLLRNKYI